MTDEFSTSGRSGDLTSLLIGFMAGLRSMTPLAAITWAQAWGWLQPRGVFAKTGTPPARLLLSLSASGEHLVDKLPMTPSRLTTPSLIVRAKTGGLSAAVLASGTDGNWLRGALLGGVGAVLGSYAGYHARVGLTAKAVTAAEAKGVPAEVVKIGVAVAEDVVAVAGSLWVLRKAGGEPRDI